MVVTSQCIGNRVIGLYVGASNVQRYFGKRVAAIELQIDHLRIACGLPAQFWLDQPEIHDARLCAWLESKNREGNGRGHRAPVSMAMIPSGKNTFILSAAAEDLQMAHAQELKAPRLELHIARPRVPVQRVAGSAALIMAAGD